MQLWSGLVARAGLAAGAAAAPAGSSPEWCHRKSICASCRAPDSITAEFIDERAAAPHWGSRAMQEALSAAGSALQSKAPTGAGQLADALRDLQAMLSSNLRQLEAQEAEQAAAAGSNVQQGLAAMSEQLRRVAEAAQQAAAAGTGLQLDLPAASAAQDKGPNTVASSTDLSSQLAQLASTQYAGYSLQTLALISAGVAALVALSVPRQRDDDDQAGSGGSSSGGGSRGSAGDALPNRWDASAVDAYYRRRPALVARRMLEVATEALSYGAALLADMATGEEGGWGSTSECLGVAHAPHAPLGELAAGALIMLDQWDRGGCCCCCCCHVLRLICLCTAAPHGPADSVGRNMSARADQAMAAIERLGPAYVKASEGQAKAVQGELSCQPEPSAAASRPLPPPLFVFLVVSERLLTQRALRCPPRVGAPQVAQALSTRVDLLPPAYLLAIQRLQVGWWAPASLAGCSGRNLTSPCLVLSPPPAGVAADVTVPGPIAHQPVIWLLVPAGPRAALPRRRGLRLHRALLWAAPGRGVLLPVRQRGGSSQPGAGVQGHTARQRAAGGHQGGL